MTVPQVEEYSFGRMVVDGREHRRDLILLPRRVVDNWWRGDGHRLMPADLTVVIEAAPEVLVVGTGANGVMEVSEETRRALADAGIELLAAVTTEAWREYNDLRLRRHTAGAFHLTC